MNKDYLDTDTLVVKKYNFPITVKFMTSNDEQIERIYNTINDLKEFFGNENVILTQHCELEIINMTNWKKNEYYYILINKLVGITSNELGILIRLSFEEIIKYFDIIYIFGQVGIISKKDLYHPNDLTKQFNGYRFISQNYLLNNPLQGGDFKGTGLLFINIRTYN